MTDIKSRFCNRFEQNVSRSKNGLEKWYFFQLTHDSWFSKKAVEPGGVFFECKEGPFVPHEEEGILKP